MHDQGQCLPQRHSMRGGRGTLAKSLRSSPVCGTMPLQPFCKLPRVKSMRSHIDALVPAANLHFKGVYRRIRDLLNIVPANAGDSHMMWPLQPGAQPMPIQAMQPMPMQAMPMPAQTGPWWGPAQALPSQTPPAMAPTAPAPTVSTAPTAAMAPAPSQALPCQDYLVQMGCGLVALDLECIHDHIHGSYAAMEWHETSDQWSWKRQCQIIELAAVNLVTGESLLLRSRPEFSWEDVKSPATRLFAEHSGHKEIVCDESLPVFAQLWPTHVLPFLQRAAGFTGKVVLIAHNGDRFDHFVLNKEIERLGLDMSRCPHLVSADPVATMKLGCSCLCGG